MRQSQEHLVFGLAGQEPAAEPLHYTLCGLDNVYLLNGFDIEDMDGEVFTAVRNVEGLHRMIALRLAVLRRPMSGQEIRFLRKDLGFTQEELAKLFRVTRKRVNEYERGDQLPRTSQIVLQLKAVRKLLDEIRAPADSDDETIRHLKPNVDAIKGWLLAIKEEIEDWILQIHEDGSEPDLPPPFICDAAIGQWKFEVSSRPAKR